MTELKEISAGYDRPVLNKVSVRFEKGKLTGIIGRNGCGKSTMLKTMLGLVDYTGQILLDGQDLRGISSRKRAQNMAFLLQSRNIPQCTVFQLVLHGRFPWLSTPRVYRKEDREKTMEALKLFGLEDVKDRLVEDLSGGQRQKVYLAMAWNQEADYLFLDEPLTYLDLPAQKELASLMQEMKKQNRAVVLVLHDLCMALEICDEIILMDQGQVLCQLPVCPELTAKIEAVYGVQIRSVEADGKKKFIVL